MSVAVAIGAGDYTARGRELVAAARGRLEELTRLLLRRAEAPAVDGDVAAAAEELLSIAEQAEELARLARREVARARRGAQGRAERRAGVAAPAPAAAAASPAGPGVVPAAAVSAGRPAPASSPASAVTVQPAPAPAAAVPAGTHPVQVPQSVPSQATGPGRAVAPVAGPPAPAAVVARSGPAPAGLAGGRGVRAWRSGRWWLAVVLAALVVLLAVAGCSSGVDGSGRFAGAGQVTRISPGSVGGPPPGAPAKGWDWAAGSSSRGNGRRPPPM